MKAIILLPGVVAFAAVFADGLRSLPERWFRPVAGVVAALCGLYVVDGLILVTQLR
jgi:hypothetical protein